MKIKTIDITALEWFDKVNGNSYFSATVTLNFGMKDQKNIALPFQYGYGDQYIHSASEELIKQGLIKIEKYCPFWQYCQDNNIILRTVKHENCKKSELKG